MTPHLIIAGTEKAGTSSVYQYLAALPGVVESTRKRLTISDFIPVRSVSTNLYLYQLDKLIAEEIRSCD